MYAASSAAMLNVVKDRRPETLALLVIAAEVRVGADRMAQLAELVGVAKTPWNASVLAFERNGWIEVVDGPDGPSLAGTVAGRRLVADIGERLARARADDLAGRGWDGRWRIVAFPDRLGDEEHALRRALRESGGAPVNDRLVVLARDRPADLQAPRGSAIMRADRLAVGTATTPRDVAAALWPVDDIAARYRAFNELWTHRELTPTPDDHPSVARTLLELLASFWGCFDGDPVLPPELLPRPWPGRQARNFLATAVRTLPVRRSDRTVARLLLRITAALEPVAA